MILDVENVENVWKFDFFIIGFILEAQTFFVTSHLFVHYIFYFSGLLYTSEARAKKCLSW